MLLNTEKYLARMWPKHASTIPPPNTPTHTCQFYPYLLKIIWLASNTAQKYAYTEDKLHTCTLISILMAELKVT